MLQHVLALHKPEVTRLNTNRQNINAINFYFKQGFTIEKLDPHQHSAGFFADDFLMKRIS